MVDGYDRFPEDDDPVAEAVRSGAFRGSDVMLVLVGLSIAANRRMKRATETPEGFQNVLELLVEKLDGVIYATMGKVAAPKFANYFCTIFVFIFVLMILFIFTFMM